MNAVSSSGHPPERLMPVAIALRKRLPDFISKLVFGKPLAPTWQEWQHIQQALNQGDPAMDKVVEWMFTEGPRHTKPLFEQALEQGIDSLDNPPKVLLEFFSLVDNDPAWVNRPQLERAVKASHLAGKVGFYVLRDMALMGGYVYFNSMNQTLASSGALSKNTGQRLGETGKWLNDVTAYGGLDRFGAGFKTTLRVRLVHALVRRHLNNKPDWDRAKWGLPINQIDMQSTYLAFGPATLMGARLFGVPVTPGNAAAVMHMWRYIGWLMGVDEQWLARTELEGLRMLFHTYLTHYLPDDKVRQLGEALRDEPFTRHVTGASAHPLKTRFKRWFRYQLHLSNSSLILGLRQRRQLGLPLWILPWYPLISAPWRFLTLAYLQLRGGATLDKYARRSRKVQEDLLEEYFGQKQPNIIQPEAHHPAHL